MKTLENALNNKMKEPSFRAEYEALEAEFSIMQAVINARLNAGLTQKQLSEKTGIDQGDISKIEIGEANPTLNTLKRLANGMNTKLILEFAPISQQ